VCSRRTRRAIPETPFSTVFFEVQKTLSQTVFSS
jgi:hypothetical protein